MNAPCAVIILACLLACYSTDASAHRAMRSALLLDSLPESIQAIEFTGNRRVGISFADGSRRECLFSLPLGSAPIRCSAAKSAGELSQKRQAHENRCLKSRNIHGLKRVSTSSDAVGIWTRMGAAVSVDYVVVVKIAAPCQVREFRYAKRVRIVGAIGKEFPSLILAEDGDYPQSYRIVIQDDVFSGNQPVRYLGIAGRSDSPAAAISGTGNLLTHHDDLSTPEMHRFCIRSKHSNPRFPSFSVKRCASEQASYSIQSMAVAPDGRTFALLLAIVDSADGGGYRVETKLYLYEMSPP